MKGKAKKKKRIAAPASAKKKSEKEKNPSVFRFAKAKENPIILPNERSAWKNRQTFNPGVVLLDGKIHFLYRSMGEDWLSRLGYASSRDGVIIDEHPSRPAYEHKISHLGSARYSCASGGSFGGAEDPRLTRVGEEDVLYMTYTACDGGLRMALTSIKLSDFLRKKWNWKSPKIISPPGEVHKNWVIFPEKINGKYAILHSVSPDIMVEYLENLDFENGECLESVCGDRLHMKGAKRENCWDSWMRGAGAPPIKTRLGWLLFYQAMDERDPGKYKVGAMILDLNNPSNVLYRAKEPLLEPNEDYENNGFKAGVVYATGAVVKDGEILLYYGASDNYVAAASAPLEDFLKSLEKESNPKLKLKKKAGEKKKKK